MRKRWQRAIAALVVAGLLASGCGASPAVPEKTEGEPGSGTFSEGKDGVTEEDKAEENPEKTAGDVLAGATESADGYRLADDYYEYMNHTFLEDVEIPDDSDSWSYFYELNSETHGILEEILAETVEKRTEHEPGSIRQKITDLYLTASDMEEREAVGMGELELYLNKLEEARTVQELVEAAASVGRELGVENLILFMPEVDYEDSDRYAVYVETPNLGPGKKALTEGTRSGEAEAFTRYAADILALCGRPEEEASERAAAVTGFLKEVAAAALPDGEEENPAAVYRRFTPEELGKLLEGIDMEGVLEAAGLEESEYIVPDPGALQCMADYLTEENLPVLKDYAVFCLVNFMAPGLPASVRNTYLAYHQKEGVIDGFAAGEAGVGERTAGELTITLMEEEFGQLYAERCFSEEDKRAVEAITERILEEYERRIGDFDWMSREAKEHARKKLEQMTVKAGCPEKWPDELKEADVLPKEEGGSLVHNMLEIIRARNALKWNRLKGPVDQEVWDMALQSVNACYDYSANEILLPAALLQAPFYDRNTSLEENYGGIGMIIAHEITHAIDETGSRYDENGSFHTWWTDEDYGRFREEAEAVSEYYEGFEATKGRHVNGRQTLEEDIADLGAISCITSIIGEDPEALQIVYGRYAQIMAAKYTAAGSARVLAEMDYAPENIRVNAALSAAEGFYQAYPGVGPGDGMYVEPEKRPKIW